MSIEKLTDNWYTRDESLQGLGHSDEKQIRALLLGRRVVEVDGDHMRLDNGTIIKVVPNEGGCSCGAGDYELKHLGLVDNAITKVEFDRVDNSGEDDWGWDSMYRIFVFADNQRINLLTIEGDDGNGYYGTGFELLVKPVTQSQEFLEQAA